MSHRRTDGGTDTALVRDCAVSNFLIGRVQYVRIANVCSVSKPVISGVPQGSVLGPVLFMIYVNDICSLAPADVRIKLFADDTKFSSIFNDVVTPDTLQSCLTAIIEWSDHWQLKLSPSKCSVLHVSPSTRSMNDCSYPYHIGDVTLPYVDCVTDIGVTYDNRLRFSSHINKIVTKASLRAKLIIRCFQSRDPSLLITAFCVFVRPILEHNTVAWSPMLKKEIHKIECVQRRFTNLTSWFA